MSFKLRSRRFLAKLGPGFFILLIWFIFSYPYFLHNKVPYPSTYQVNHFFPWSAYEKYWGPVKNGAMPDIIDQIYPWRHFAIETWKKLQVPSWNPYSFSGNPHLANYQSAVFSPFNLFFFLFPFVDAWSILVLLQPLLAGIFTYVLLREFKVGKTGALIAAVSFMFSGFMVVWMAYGTLSFAITFLPLALYAIESWFNKRDKLSLVLLAISIPLSFFSGHFQTSLYFLMTVLVFLLFKVWGKLKHSLPILFLFLVGLAISLVQIIPSVQFYFQSVRSEIFFKGDGIPFFYLITIFAPDFFGNPVTRNDWLGYYAEWASFIGIIPFVLALYAFSLKNKKCLFFFVLGLVSLLLAVKSPLQELIADLRIPVISTSNPTRIIVLFSFSFAVLAGFGFEKLKEYVIKKRLKRVVNVLLPILLLFLAVWIALFVFSEIPPENLLVARRNFILPTAIFIFLSLFTLTSFFLKEKLKFFPLFLLVILTSFDSLRFAKKWMPFDPKELVFPDTPVIQGIRENIGNGRIFGNFGANIDVYYGFPGIEGYDPLYIERYGEFIRSALSGKLRSAERSVVQIDRRGEFTDRVLDLLGVSLIFHPIADTNQPWAYPVWSNSEKYTVVWQDDRFQLFRNNTALPRAKLFYAYEIIKNQKDIIGRFYNEDFDFRNTLILEEKPGLMVQNSTYREGEAEILSYEPNYVSVKIETKSPALLFLSDNYYPGWRAFVNGKETKIYRADYTFRAVEVPRGQSLVEFRYDIIPKI